VRDDRDPRGRVEVLRPSLSRGGALSQLIPPGPEFRQLFRTFEHTAFRLEARDTYDVTYENESLRRFLAGEPDYLPSMQSWLDMLREATAQGRRFARVRVVSMPLTDYSRFGVWCAQFTNAAGEDIRYLQRDQAEAENLPRHDYWLFDSARWSGCISMTPTSSWAGRLSMILR
jgi:hypothetical protein